jgi:hypothetical protein
VARDESFVPAIFIAKLLLVPSMMILLNILPYYLLQGQNIKRK